MFVHYYGLGNRTLHSNQGNNKASFLEAATAQSLHKTICDSRGERASQCRPESPRAPIPRYPKAIQGPSCRCAGNGSAPRHTSRSLKLLPSLEALSMRNVLCYEARCGGAGRGRLSRNCRRRRFCPVSIWAVACAERLRPCECRELAVEDPGCLVIMSCWWHCIGPLRLIVSFGKGGVRCPSCKNIVHTTKL